MRSLRLKPCPFCGNKEVYMQSEPYGYAVMCFCGASGPGVDEDEEYDEDPQVVSQKKWNRRYPKEEK